MNSSSSKGHETRASNAPSSGTGFVIRVEAAYLAQYEKHDVGGSDHSEYWIPAERLDEFNRHIIGLIEVIAEFRRGS